MQEIPPPPPPALFPQGRIKGGGGGGGGSWGSGLPTPSGGPPNFIKREKTSRAWARKRRVLVLNSYPDPTPPPFRNPVSAPVPPVKIVDTSVLSSYVPEFILNTSGNALPSVGNHTDTGDRTGINHQSLWREESMNRLPTPWLMTPARTALR